MWRIWYRWCFILTFSQVCLFFLVNNISLGTILNITTSTHTVRLRKKHAHCAYLVERVGDGGSGGGGDLIKLYIEVHASRIPPHLHLWGKARCQRIFCVHVKYLRELVNFMVNYSGSTHTPPVLRVFPLVLRLNFLTKEYAGTILQEVDTNEIASRQRKTPTYNFYVCFCPSLLTRMHPPCKR
jgi:hypothetical protein